MTNYINTIELNGTDYAVGPFSVDSSNNIIGWFNGDTSIIGTNNLVIGGSNSITGSDNVVVATPGTATTLSANSNVVLATPNTSICVSENCISIGNAVTVDPHNIHLGAMNYVHYTPGLVLTHSYPLSTILATIPCEIFLVGHVNHVRSISDTHVISVAAFTRIYYTDTDEVSVEGHYISTVSGMKLYAYAPNLGGRRFGFSVSNGAIYVGNPCVDDSTSDIYDSCVVDMYTYRGAGA